MTSNVKFILSVFLSALSMTALAASFSTVMARYEITHASVTEFLLVNVGYGLPFGGIVGLLLAVSVVEERDDARYRNALPKRGNRK